MTGAAGLAEAIEGRGAAEVEVEREMRVARQANMSGVGSERSMVAFASLQKWQSVLMIESSEFGVRCGAKGRFVATVKRQ